MPRVPCRRFCGRERPQKVKALIVFRGFSAICPLRHRVGADTKRGREIQVLRAGR